MRNLRVVAVFVLALSTTACAKSADKAAPALEISSSPQYVQRIIPGHRPVALVSVGAEQGRPVTLAATSSIGGATVSMQPSTVTGAQASEVWIDLPETTEEVPFSVTVTATLGSTTRSTTITATAVPGVDDLAPTATEIAAVFLKGLTEKAPELPDTTQGLTGGTPVAGLLVVSHYAWFTDTLEIGLAWHIMVAPDDFSELYIRPRGQLVPARAFRINSWSTALSGGAFTLVEIPPPPEVTR